MPRARRRRTIGAYDGWEVVSNLDQLSRRSPGVDRVAEAIEGLDAMVAR